MTSRAALAVALGVVLTACAGTQVVTHREASSAQPPEWLTRLPTSSVASLFVARGEGPDLASARAAARKDAAQQAALIAGAFVRYRHVAAADSGRAGDVATDVTSAFVQAVVSGLVPQAEHWTRALQAAGAWSRETVEVAWLVSVQRSAVERAMVDATALIASERASAAGAARELESLLESGRFAEAEILGAKLADASASGVLDTDDAARVRAALVHLAHVAEAVDVRVTVDGRPSVSRAGVTALAEALGGKAVAPGAAARWRARIDAWRGQPRPFRDVWSLDLRCELAVEDSWRGVRVGGVRRVERGFGRDVEAAEAEGLRRCLVGAAAWASAAPIIVRRDERTRYE